MGQSNEMVFRVFFRGERVGEEQASFPLAFKKLTEHFLNRNSGNMRRMRLNWEDLFSSGISTVLELEELVGSQDEGEMAASSTPGVKKIPRVFSISFYEALKLAKTLDLIHDEVVEVRDLTQGAYNEVVRVHFRHQGSMSNPD